MIEKLPKERELAMLTRERIFGGTIVREKRADIVGIARLGNCSRSATLARSQPRRVGDETRVGIFRSGCERERECETHFSRNGAFPAWLRVPLYFQERLRKAKEQEEVIHARHCYPTLGTLDRNRTWKPTGLSRPVAVFSRVSSPPPPLSPSLTPLILSRPSRAFVAVAEHRSTRLTRRIVRARSRL